MKHTDWELKQKQALPLPIKIKMTERRIREWLDENEGEYVYLSFSGGKDSTVLYDIIQNMGINIPAVFVNTGLEYPSIKEFAESKENVKTIKPKKSFKQVLCEYGYPIISKEVSLYVHQLQMPPTKDNEKTRNLRLYGIRSDGVKVNIGKLPERWKFLIDAPFKISNQCCDIMKKQPFHAEKGKPITATMADESRARKIVWLRHGCNAFNTKNPISQPMAFWTEQDVLKYIYENGIDIAKPYGEVVKDKDQIEMDCCKCEKYKTTKANRTGCVFCMFGIMKDKKRFCRLKDEEPKLYDYVIRGGQFVDGIWQPSKEGLGYGYVIKWLNENGNLGIQL